MPPKLKRAKVSSQPDDAVSDEALNAYRDSPISSGSEEIDDESDSSSASSKSDNDSSSSSVDPNMEVHVDFEAHAIDDEDFHGIRRLLLQVFLKSNIDISGLTNLIIEQAGHVGSTIKVCDEQELPGGDVSTEATDPISLDSDDWQVFGITSLVSLAYHHDKQCVKQVKDMLLSQCESHGGSIFTPFSALLSKQVGLLINERFINIPSEIAPPLLSGLMMELREASRKMKDQFSCQYYLLVTRSHLMSLPSPVHKRKRKEGRKKGYGDSGGSVIIENSVPTFDYLESELLQKDSAMSFSYPVSEESDQVLGGKWSFDDNALKPYRTVMVFESQKFDQAISKLKENYF